MPSSEAAKYEIQSEAFEKQARGASKMAEKLMDEGPTDKPGAAGDAKLKSEVKSLNVKLSEAVSAKEKAELDLDVVKQQAASMNKEYDRLMKELEKAQGGGSKDD